MANKIKKILGLILEDTHIDKLEHTKKEIEKILGQNFYEKHIKKMFFENKSLKIISKSIEAKTEINLIKKNLNIINI
tara:strand:+ start:154 stop:384 length:231 start_codon:yes stop_codon:yes gene_type:complete